MTSERPPAASSRRWARRCPTGTFPTPATLRVRAELRPVLLHGAAGCSLLCVGHHAAAVMEHVCRQGCPLSRGWVRVMVVVLHCAARGAGLSGRCAAAAAACLYSWGEDAGTGEVESGLSLFTVLLAKP